MENLTPRLGLPQLAIAQAHKEITHNEALALIDAFLHPAIETVVASPPETLEGDAGKCWLVGPTASGSFAGHVDHIAYWTGGSWRFAAPQEGMRVWQRDTQYFINYRNRQWQVPPVQPAANGGATIDVEARAALAQLVGQLAAAGLLRPS